MKITLDQGRLYVDNVKFCYYGVNQDDGRKDLQPGSYECNAQYAHHFGKVLPNITGIGWIGSDSGAAIILGKARDGAKLLAHECVVQRLVAAIEANMEARQAVTVEVI